MEQGSISDLFGMKLKESMEEFGMQLPTRRDLGIMREKLEMFCDRSQMVFAQNLKWNEDQIRIFD